MIKLTDCYWYGNKASDYAIEMGYLDYKTFSDAFPHILNNSIIETALEHDMYFEQVNGGDDDNEEYPEIYQYYIVPEWAVNEILSDTFEPVFYCAELDLYLWGVTHWGTSWDMVLTDIQINAGDK